MTTEKIKISDTGFSKDEKRYIVNEQGDIIMHAYGDNAEQAEATAKRMVKAWNTHDELIEVLKWAKKVIDANVPKQAGHGSLEILPKIDQLLKQAE